jgi:hypothetical protein
MITTAHVKLRGLSFFSPAGYTIVYALIGGYSIV